MNKQKILVVGSGIFVVFFTGFPHLWSIYQPYIMENTGWSVDQSRLCFYFALITFAFGNVFGGKIQDRYKPSYAIWLGGIISTISVLSSTYTADKSLIGMYVGYAFQGIGQGMIYTTVISVFQKWFPTKIGFASGLAVTANAMCGFILAPPSRYWLQHYGANTTFLFVGILVGISWILGSVFVKNPPNYEALSKDYSSNNNLTTAQMIKTKEFYLLFIAMVASLLAYFLVSPMAQIIQEEKGVPTEYTIYAIMLGPIANASFKLLLPTIADKLGRLRILKYNIIIGISGMILIWLGTGFLSSIGIVLVYGSYGGVLGSFPSITSQYFGVKYQGQNYGTMLFGLSFASVSAPITYGFIEGNSYVYAAIVSFVIAFLLVVVLDKNTARSCH
ncbi:hypothetical protein AN639_10800 [Candidatus Epulonipiscium fishelsonii]|uniref:Uncharacterized protein n=1 Tax=Candidatus Epulonipiscium fishelsonii TaxID=77094 RepID=A0ACC8XFD6_9FIRM|nr:hypothetical protein AN396_02970 [Epulopiscium sp. SCG-B11WGA-EpuloA1]ONI43250.1 hypothetical protein AN639_10800 [Epulopiscium sp. SCG-B05WGA-EpuloA1]